MKWVNTPKSSLSVSLGNTLTVYIRSVNMRIITPKVRILVSSLDLASCLGSFFHKLGASTYS